MALQGFPSLYRWGLGARLGLALLGIVALVSFLTWAS